MSLYAAAMAAGALGVTLNCSMAWPQVWRATRTVEGIALGTVFTGFASRMFWSAYALHGTLDAPLLLGQLPVAIGFAFIAGAVGVRRGDLRLRLLLTLIGIVAGVILLGLISPVLLVAGGVGVLAVMNLPQMIGVLRRPESSRGVSAAMYWLTAAASASWIAYGFMTGDPFIPLPHFLLLPTGIATAIAVQRSRRRTAKPANQLLAEEQLIRGPRGSE